jgi:hypothetical protein
MERVLNSNDNGYTPKYTRISKYTYTRIPHIRAYIAAYLYNLLNKLSHMNNNHYCTACNSSYATTALLRSHR